MQDQMMEDVRAMIEHSEEMARARRDIIDGVYSPHPLMPPTPEEFERDRKADLQRRFKERAVNRVEGRV